MAAGALLTGPGTHIHLLQTTLSKLGYLKYHISYYPDWKIFFNDGSYKKISYYRPVVHLMWALWRRIPYWREFEHPRLWQFAFYDWLCAKYLPHEIDFLYAWSGTSLYTMRKAKKLGKKVFLEFPASHPIFWNEIANKIYRSLPLSKGKFGILPAGMVQRILKEIKKADRVVVLSSFVRQQMIDYGVPEEKLALIPLAVETELFAPPPSLSKSIFRVLYVGRIDPLKGVHVLLEAWKQLALPKAELWIAGHTVPEMYPIMKKYEGIFKYLGPFPREKLTELYREASLFVFPTLMDSFGMVLLEAMASGLPVIATTHSAAPDLLTEGLIPPGDVEALKAAIIDFYRRPDLQDIGRANRQRVEENFTPAHYAKRIQMLLESHGL